MADDALMAPFPYFGGKSKIAPKVWQALGSVDHYIEPFFGSGAVLLLRPAFDPTHHTETVCDKDGFISNVWRSLQFSPDETARWCDWPVDHPSLSARKQTLIKNENRLLENLSVDEKWHDPVMAGYWIWAASCWIGSGLTSIGQIPHASNAGMGVHKIGQIPHVSNAGMGVHKIGKIPHISDTGRNIHKLSQRSHMGNASVDIQDPYNTNIYEWFRKLSERLRYVRVVCGDWTRVCGGNWQDNLGTVGIFFDPPYGVETRDTEIYRHDSTEIAEAVRKWAAERGSKPSYRIVIAGYEEHLELEKSGWRIGRWTARGGYSSMGDGARRENRKREHLYFSPHCLKEQDMFNASSHEAVTA